MIEVLFFLITTYLLIQNKLDIKHITKSIILFSVIVVVITIYQLFALFLSEGTFFGNIQVIIATFANKNLLSSILFLTLPFVLNSIVLSKLWQKVSIVLFPLMLILFLIIQTKAVIAALFVFFILFFIFFFKYRKDIIVKYFIKAIIGETFLIMIFAGIFVLQNKQHLSHLTSTHTAFTRLSLWDNSVQMAEENLILGVGAGNWQVHFPKYGLDKFDVKNVKDGLTTYQRPHNDFLRVYCEQGIIGILSYVSIFIIVLFYLSKLLRKSKKGEDKWLFTFLLAAIAGYLIIALVDFPFERVEHQVLLLLMISIITANYYKNFIADKTLNKPIVKLPFLTILFVLPVMFSFIISVNRYSGEYHTQKLYKAHHKANWNLMLREADKTINSCYVMDPMAAPIEWYKGVAFFSLGNIDEAKISFEKAYSIHPYNIHVLNNLASCYENLGEYQKAEETYLKALSISSEFVEARLNLSAVYYNMKEYEKAFETIDKCDINSVDPKYQIFLPVILNSWLDVLISKEKDMNIVEKISDIKNSDDKLVELYFESKIKNISFEVFIKKSLIPDTNEL
ncbi:MAG: O-antigen ligase family protein [Bacteroidales bacterium]|nr:O-antigen ligase family protein [Bacteroidales bacterium]